MYESTSQVVFENLASEIKEMLSCKSIDLATFKNSETLKKKHELPCDEECLIAERNKNFANALQIDPTVRAKPIYTDFLKQYARDDLTFVLDVEKQFESIYDESLQSRFTKKVYNLPIMKSFERKFIHELASYYGLETASHSNEPQRFVAITASKDKCFVPSPTLTQSVEAGASKFKMPTIKQLENSYASSSTTSNLITLKSAAQTAAAANNNNNGKSAASYNLDDEDANSEKTSEQYQDDLDCLIAQSVTFKNLKLNDLTTTKQSAADKSIDYFDMID